MRKPLTRGNKQMKKAMTSALFRPSRSKNIKLHDFLRHAVTIEVSNREMSHCTKWGLYFPSDTMEWFLIGGIRIVKQEHFSYSNSIMAMFKVGNMLFCN